MMLFIDHCGPLNQQEAINAGVPVLCYPIDGQNMYIAEMYKHLSMGIVLDEETATKLVIKFKRTVVEIIDNRM